jgi:hypothetical protein
LEGPRRLGLAPHEKSLRHFLLASRQGFGENAESKDFMPGTR